MERSSSFSLSRVCWLRLSELETCNNLAIERIIFFYLRKVKLIFVSCYYIFVVCDIFFVPSGCKFYDLVREHHQFLDHLPPVFLLHEDPVFLGFPVLEGVTTATLCMTISCIESNRQLAPAYKMPVVNFFPG